MSTPHVEAIDPSWHPDTLALRSGSQRTHFGEHSEALFLTSSYVFNSAEEAAKRFKGETPGHVYSRFSNPTVDMLQTRIATLEGVEACLMTASGMSAIFLTVLGLLSSGDHLVASRGIFGSTQQFFSQWLPRWGIKTTFVESTDLREWERAFTPETKLVFLETPSNPLTDIFDIQGIANLTHAHQALLAVDNCFCSPALQQPARFGADIIIHSATKYLDGQGRVLGGAVAGAHRIIHEKLYPFLRTVGPSISPFNAWIILKGIETLTLRMFKQSENALKVAQWLKAHPAVSNVNYPGLATHPGYILAQRQQKAGGAIISFELKGGQEQAWSVIDNTQLMSITANLGDTRSTITHPATTTHGRLSDDERAKARISQSLIRLAIGLEYSEDIINDLAVGLNKLA
ncbi:MAG: O-succinylhomoserine sulfhydrylase [Pseudomonadota bacterium]